MKPSEPISASALPDSRGLNLYRADPGYRGLLALYLEPALYVHLEPHFDRLGALAGSELDLRAAEADRNPPVLHHRTRTGEDRQWIEKHPSYRRLEEVAFSEYGLAAMSHRGGVLGWPKPMPPLVKYALTYLYVQAEFGVCCPLSMTDAAARTIAKFADPALAARYLPGLTGQDLDAMTQGAMFMTEQGAGSDVGASVTVAVRDGDSWQLTGDKWFCSNADAGVALVLARTEGAPAGTRGLSLFVLPRVLPDGRSNSYRIVRLKEKLGTRGMASGEIRLEGAQAYLVGDPQRGFVQMADMINTSRLSNGMRAAGMMRRALTEALFVARRRVAFGKELVELPLMRRQLMKLMLAAEAARSIVLFTAVELAKADAGDEQARRRVRLLTPLLKFRACRDVRRAAGDAMEVRGGIGYIEEWATARLVRDAQIGTLWEGTSNMNALDVVQRAVGKSGGHKTLSAALKAKYEPSGALPGQYKGLLGATLDRVERFVEAVAADPKQEKRCRLAAGALYHATTAALMAWEGATLGAQGGDARRLLLSRLVIEHRLSTQDPLSLDESSWEQEAMDLLLDDAPVPLAKAVALVG